VNFKGQQYLRLGLHKATKMQFFIKNKPVSSNNITKKTLIDRINWISGPSEFELGEGYSTPTA
jgi:hypothetical protein